MDLQKKTSELRESTRRKSRHVIRGFMQREGIDFTETFSLENVSLTLWHCFSSIHGTASRIVHSEFGSQIVEEQLSKMQGWRFHILQWGHNHRYICNDMLILRRSTDIHDAEKLSVSEGVKVKNLVYIKQLLKFECDQSGIYVTQRAYIEKLWK